MNDKMDIEAIYPLSPMQSGMLFHTLREPDGGLYIEQVIYRLQGRIDADALREAWQRVVTRHSALRSLFVWENRKKPLQVVRKQVSLPWTALDLRDLAPEAQEQRVAAFLRADRQKGFALNRPPLMRFALIRQTEDIHAFIWSHHHILMDGWCLPILFKEVLACYRAAVRGETVDLAPAQPFQAYIAWLQRQDPAEAKAFWKTRLAGFTTPTILAERRCQERPPCGEGLAPHREERIALGQGLTRELRELARGLHLTLNTFLQAGWAILLSRYSRERDVAFGAVVSGRPQDLPGVESMVGLFINTVPVRVRFSADQTLLTCLQALHAGQADLTAYSYTPLSEIQAVSGLKPDTPLFESILAFENYPVDPGLKENDMGIRVLGSRIWEKTNYPLNLMISPGKVLSIKALYDEDRFRPETIRRMLGHYRMLLAGLGQNITRPVSALNMLEPGEKARLLVAFNATDREARGDTRVHHRVQQLAAEQPDQLAVVCRDQHLTYAQLNTRANILARAVRKAAAGPYPRVGLVMQRDPEMIVAMLAVLKAGGAYVPLDPSYPFERIRYILADAKASLVLTGPDAALDPASMALPVLSIPKACDNGQKTKGEAMPGAVRLGGDLPDKDFPAYVIYTSGSTGRPKGVMISHGALENLIAWHQRTFSPKPGDRAGQAAGPAFDASVWEIWSGLSAGATLHLLPPELAGSAEALQHWLLSEKLDTCFLPTPLAQEMLALAWPRDMSLAILHTGGDSLQRVPPPELPFTLVNHYGPTECTVIAVSGAVSGQGEDPRPHVGRPIDNMRAFILDPDLAPVPLGVPGELCLAGRGLAMGYLDRPDLTAQHFIPNPFAREKGERLYKTGDLARYRDDGTMEIIQRLDDQVKIRGFRVETGEIENVLLTHPQIREVKVLARQHPSGARRLAAYLVSSAELTREALHRYLAARLPDYMIPPDMMFLPGLPRSANGKIDRQALPDPDSAATRVKTGYTAPRSEVETILSQIWAEVLNLAQVGVHDDFFSLGGDSILSIQIMSRASRQGLRFTLQQLFQYPTIAALAPLVRSSASPKNKPAPLSGPVALTPVQHWFFEQEMPEPHHFNQAMLFKTTSDATPEILEQIVGHLMADHPSLRLRFTREGNRWHQSYGPVENPLPFSVEDLSMRPPAEQTRALASLAADYQTRLDLTRGPLCRFVFFRFAPGPAPARDLHALPRRASENRLLIIIHHLAVDGVSWRILLEDLQTAFSQIKAGRPVTLPGEKDSFQTWAAHLRAYAQSEKISAEAAYWLKEGRSGPGPLPVDFPRAAGQNISGSCDQVRVVLDRDDTHALVHRLPEVYRARMDEVLLTALAQTICRWTGQDGLRVTLEGHGRESFIIAPPVPLSSNPDPGSALNADPDISHTTGWFTSLYPVVLFLENKADPGRALISIKEQLRQIPNKGAGFGVLKYLCRKVAITSALAGAPRVTPWPEVTFNYLGQMSAMFSSPPMAGPAAESPGPDSSARAPRDHLLNIGALIVDESLRINWIYSRALHRRETIEGLAADFRQHLKNLIAHCRSPQVVGLSASDVPGARLDQGALETFMAELESRQ
jgi:amino acid adenylation domain-containing protein/non-ribosomal peptide synthase protein (TIGR01720 family)